LLNNGFAKSLMEASHGKR